MLYDGDELDGVCDLHRKRRGIHVASGRASSKDTVGAVMCGKSEDKEEPIDTYNWEVPETAAATTKGMIPAGGDETACGEA